jgi:hypothetical protein
MSDDDLSETTYAIIGGLIAMALLIFVMGEPMARLQFINNCAETIDRGKCVEMWELGNG